MKKVSRKTPEELKSVVFDEYVYTSNPQTFGGRVVCRNTGEDLPFNDYNAEKDRIHRWKKDQVAKVIDCRTKKQLGLVRVFKIKN